MGLFTSRREGILWLLALVVIAGIYSTLWLAGTLVDELSRRDLVDAAFVVAFMGLLAATILSGLRQMPGLRQIWISMGVASVYAMVLLRTGIPDERTHLFEYSLVAVLVYRALIERSRSSRVPVPAVIAVLGTAAVGLIDESVQAVIPSRHFDWRDIVFNCLAAFMGVAASVAVSWAERRRPAP